MALIDRECLIEAVGFLLVTACEPVRFGKIHPQVRGRRVRYDRPPEIITGFGQFALVQAHHPQAVQDGRVVGRARKGREQMVDRPRDVTFTPRLGGGGYQVQDIRNTHLAAITDVRCSGKKKGGHKARLFFFWIKVGD
ncbi:hypothetical protein [Sphingopyxis sp.]|uniref:hypothetical protein n=1 Tax=Sphingopyxis sp. TaxID=1908224 RepID=UPI003D13D945